MTKQEALLGVWLRSQTSFDLVRTCYNIYLRNRKLIEGSELPYAISGLASILNTPEIKKLFESMHRKVLDEDLPRMQAYSTVLLLFSTYEALLKQVVDAYQSDRGFADGWNAKGRESPTEKYKEYARKHNLPLIVKTDFISDATAVRNCIAHRNGYFESTRKKDEQALGLAIKRQKGLALDSEKRILVAPEFCEASHNKLKAVILSLIRTQRTDMKATWKKIRAMSETMKTRHSAKAGS
jgi:hypothetical protein